jgi:hypothetical protein
MKYTFICFLFLIGVFNCLHAQDKVVLRNGKTIDVKVHRSTESDVYYTYPGETSVYERPKSAISYILYSDGRREIFDGSQRSTEPSRIADSPATSRSTAPVRRNQEEEDIYWQDVKTTLSESDVRGMTRLNRISAKSNISYRDAITQLKKKAAEIGGTTVLVMDIPENDDMEVLGIVYKDQKTDYTPRSATERSSAPVESSSNIRRRQIAQQMESYNNESNLEFEDYSRDTRSSSASSRTAQPQRSASAQPRQSSSSNEPDAVFLTNGRVIRGVIEEYDPDDFVSIRSSAGRVYEFSMDDVRRVDTGSRNTRASASARNAPASQSRANTRYSDDRYNDRNASRFNDDYDDYGVSGYKGIFDLGYNFSIGGAGEKGAFEFNTSHGYQINEYFFAGAGLGLHIYNARDTAMKNPNSYPQYVGTVGTNGKIKPADSVTYIRAVDSSFMTLPIFLDVRAYLPIQNSKVTPFFMLRFGYAFNLSDGFKGMGMYMNPALGVKFQLSPMIGINFSAGYAYQSYGGIPKNGGYGYYYIKDATKQKYEAKGAGGISLKLGIEF